MLKLVKAAFTAGAGSAVGLVNTAGAPAGGSLRQRDGGGGEGGALAGVGLWALLS